MKALEKPRDRPSPRIPEIPVISPQSNKKTSTYANAALLLKKQLDPTSLAKKVASSDAPPGTKPPVLPKESHSRKEKEPDIWVNLESAGKKRVVSMANKSQYDRDISPEPRERETDRALPSRYDDDARRKPDSDKYVKNFYERKTSRRSHSPDSPRRRSPDRYRSPSPGYRSRGRSRGRTRSPEYRSRGRSRGRSPESWNRGRSRSRPRYCFIL